MAFAGGATLPYDKLILSPGIDFVDDSVRGWPVAAQNAMPHAYEAGSQTELLKAQVDAMALIEEGWARHCPRMIDGIEEEFGSADVSVDPTAMTLDMDGDVIQVDVCNVIPATKAGRIADSAGVTECNWAPVNAIDMSSKVDPDNYVLCDASQQGDMPKSVFSANSQAKVCANAVRAALTGSTQFPAPYANTCWSLIDAEYCVKVGPPTS